MMPKLFEDLALASRRLDEGQATVVGWGTGSLFQDLQGAWRVPLTHLFDNDPSRWGLRIGGLEVQGPEHLTRSDPASTVVIVYSSFWQDIRRQVEALGPYLCVPASLLLQWPYTARRLASLARVLGSPRAGGRRSARAVIVQGPVDDAFAPLALGALGQALTDEYLILSTWDDTPSHLLDAVRPVVDAIVCSSKPPVAGTQNRNLQIVSTHRGLEAARALGVSHVVKTRTDMVLDASGLFQLCDHMQSLYDDRARRAGGLRARLVVPVTFTRVHLLLHPSDLVMWGHIDDLCTYWSAPFDDGPVDLLSPEWRHRTLLDLYQSGQPAETYFARHFCRTITGTLPEDAPGSWAFLRDYFVVADNEWFGMFWLKNPGALDIRSEVPLRALMSHRTWQQLVLDWDAATSRLQSHPERTAFADFIGHPS